MLQNESLAAKIGFDTAENGLPKDTYTHTSTHPTTYGTFPRYAIMYGTGSSGWSAKTCAIISSTVLCRSCLSK